MRCLCVDTIVIMVLRLYVSKNSRVQMHFTLSIIQINTRERYDLFWNVEYTCMRVDKSRMSNQCLLYTYCVHINLIITPITQA